MPLQVSDLVLMLCTVSLSLQRKLKNFLQTGFLPLFWGTMYTLVFDVYGFS